MDHDFIPGPPRWANQDAKARYDELTALAKNVAEAYRRAMDAELEPIFQEISKLYAKHAVPTLYPVPKDTKEPS